MARIDPSKDREAYLQDCVRIEPMALSEEYVRLPSDLAYWSGQYADVYQFWLERKLATEQMRAQRSREVRALLDAKKDKGRVTAAEVDAELEVDPGCLQAKGKEIAAEAEKVRLWGVVDAIRSKREMLVSLGAHQRLEMQMDPMVGRRVAIEHEVDSQGGRKPR